MRRERLKRAGAGMGLWIGLLLAGVPAEAVPQVPESATGQEAVVVYGTVHAEDLRPDGLLPGALVQVRQGDGVRSAVTDSRGRYRIQGLGAGEAAVTVTHLAARSLQVHLRLPSSGEVSLDLELERRVLTLAPIEVQGHPGPGISGLQARTESGRAMAMGMRTLDASTGMAESGLAGVLGSLSPEEEPFQDRVLFTRGSTVDSRTVLLDGAPVLTPFHAAGLLPPFEMQYLDTALHFLGGAPSPYAGGLSSVLDVATRTPRPERFGGNVTMDGLVAGGSAEIPLPGGGGALVGGRYLHGLQSDLLGDGRFPYEYGDLLLRWHLPLADGHRVDYTGYLNREGVHLDEVLLDGGRARWGNRVTSARYTGRWGGVRLSVVAAASRYSSSLPLDWVEPVLARGSAHQARTGLKVTVPREGWTAEVGLSLDRSEYVYSLDPRVDPGFTTLSSMPIGLESDVLGGYGEVRVPVGDRVRLRGGARIQHFSREESVRLAPRGAASVTLSESAELTVSAGRYHQHVPLPGLVSRTDGEGSATLEWNPRFPVASANHLVLSLDQMLDEHLHVEVSGFVKTFEGLFGAHVSPPASDGSSGEGISAPDQGGRMSSSGTDLRIARDGERVSGWIGYGLSWFWENRPGRSSTNFTGRHLVSAGVRSALSDGLELGLTAGYGAGLPLSAVPLAAPEFATDDTRGGRVTQVSAGAVHRLSAAGGEGPPLDVAPRDDFLRLDLELAWETSPHLGGRSTRLRPYVRVLNALNQRDSLFQYLDRWREGDVQPVANRPLMPVVGVEWRF